MMHNRKKSLGRITKGVRPSFVIAGILGVAIIAATAFWMRPNDTLIGLVPSDAAIYIHENRVGDGNLRIPSGLHPREVAVVGLQNDDAELSWGMLFSWGASEPNAEERTLLLQIGAKEVVRGAFLLSDDTVLQKIAGVSIFPDTTRSLPLSIGLRQLRPIYRIQGFINIGVLPPRSLPVEMVAIKELAPIVFGLAISERKIFAVALSEESTEAQNPIDPISILFAGVEEDRLLSDLPMDPTFNEARAALQAALSEPYSITIAPGRNTMEFSARFRKLKPGTALTVVTDYIEAALPDSQTLALPDNDDFEEYMASQPMTVTETAADDWLVSVEPLDLELHISSDQHGGTLINSQINSRSRGHISTLGGLLPDSSCPSSKTQTSFKVGVPQVFHTFLSTYFQHYPHVSSVLFTNSGDNEVKVCGY